MSMSGQRRLELERERMEAIRLEQVRRECSNLLTACETATRAVRDIAVQQLAAPRLRASAEALRLARERIATAPDEARSQLLAVAGEIQQAIAAAEADARAWTEQQARAIAEARHAGVAAAVAGEGGSGDAEAVRLAQAAAVAAERGDVESATRLAQTARAAADRASNAAVDERVRREVVKSLVATLKDMGFVTTSPTLNAGVVILEGRLASGRRARFDVSLDGEMTFDLDGYEGRSCADDMEKVESTLKDQFGVRLGPAQVVWKNPDRLSKGARDLPGGSSAQKR